MAKLPPKSKKSKIICREELLNLDKSDLVDKILQLEAHNAQLKNIITKNTSDVTKNESENNKRKFDFAKCYYRHVLLRILYFGWDYQGLAVQEDSSQTIEHHLFHALTKSCLIQNRERSQYHRCGRTDKGVSAFGQVISISIRSKHSPDDQHHPSSISSEMPYCKILNRLLPKEIRVVAWMPIPEDESEYSARFSCKTRQYKYYFPRSSLDINSMRVACGHLVGSHDFRHLCKMDVGNGVTEFTRNIFKANVLPVEKEIEDPTTMYYLLIEGNAFLWHQIRCIMGVLILVGRGDESPDIVKELLDVDKIQRKPQYNMALDTPLNLFHASYDLENVQEWVYERDELKSVIAHLQSEWTIYNIKATMLKESIQQLEKEYAKICASEKDADIEQSEKDRVVAYTNCLLQGVQPKKMPRKLVCCVMVVLHALLKYEQDAILCKILVNEKRFSKWLQCLSAVCDTENLNTGRSVICSKHVVPRFITPKSRLLGGQMKLQKICSIIFDEMSLETALSYNKSKKLCKNMSAALSYTANFSTYVDSRPVSTTLRNTAEVVSFFDQLFDSVHGASINKKKHKGKEHHSFWPKAIEILEKLK
ncbi:unnamed protein product [Diatraea saccharalis]|uniref:Pseudouridine synthase I TruA alpha/beta domain-containing protein n=1 Tax=Diatraea saccharalis TaxID=40085 RepID=A0A9N9RD53_9NEOP|nr:unnamed protein product [Diatraea saccharalis]